MFQKDLLKHDDAPFLAKYHRGLFQGVLDPHMNLESSFYLSSPDTDDHYNVFLIKVIDSDGKRIEGARLKIDTAEPIRSGQLVTDGRGHAFVAFDHGVKEAVLNVEPPTACNGKLYRYKRHHLKRQQKRHTIVLDVVKRAEVHLSVDLDGSSDFWIWTNKGEHFKKKFRKHQIEKFHVDLEASEIHVLNYDASRGLLFYRSLEVENEAFIKKDLHPSKSSSVLTVQEAQSQASIEEALVDTVIGLPHRQAFRFEFKGSTMTLDTPEGLLVSWSVRAPQHSLEKGSGITPMAETLQLLKKVDINVAVCLEGSNGDTNAAEKEAQLEALLEYEWASQDDAREIIPVDKHGNVLLKNIPAPAPGEGLNVTLISRLGSTYSMDKHHHHRKHAHHSATLYHDMINGPVQLSFCHQLERLVVMVTDAASGWPLDGAHVHLSVSDEEHLSQRTDDDGLALLSYNDLGAYHKIKLHVTHDHYDSKDLTKYIHSSKEQSDIVHISLYPQVLFFIFSVRKLHGMIKYVGEGALEKCISLF